MTTRLNGSATFLLTVGKQYELIIKNLLPAAGSFAGQEPGKTFYNHDMLLENDFGDQFLAQICDLNNYFNLATVGDRIMIAVSKAPAANIPNGKYSVKFIDNLTPKDKRGGVLPNNPVIGGTAAAIALQWSTEWFKFNAETNDDTLYSRADKNFQWLINKAAQ